MASVNNRWDIVPGWTKAEPRASVNGRWNIVPYCAKTKQRLSAGSRWNWYFATLKDISQLLMECCTQPRVSISDSWNIARCCTVTQTRADRTLYLVRLKQNRGHQPMVDGIAHLSPMEVKPVWGILQKKTSLPVINPPHMKILIIQHIEAEAKWPPFRRRYFQTHFLEWKR